MTARIVVGLDGGGTGTRAVVMVGDEILGEGDGPPGLVDPRHPETVLPAVVETTKAALENADVEAAFHDAFGDGPGVLLLSGTGSVAWGRSEDGEVEPRRESILNIPTGADFSSVQAAAQAGRLCSSRRSTAKGGEKSGLIAARRRANCQGHYHPLRSQ